jgi:hypothetical protein
MRSGYTKMTERSKIISENGHILKGLEKKNEKILQNIAKIS